ncbi:hypothetical protein HYU13_04330 [Candidatus Woesearchaeota archaeon]|nr:hypothetical protein [Candidatus Woesearchaeota archaeon]
MMFTKTVSVILNLLLVLPLSSALSLVDDPTSCEATKWYKPSTWFPCLPDKAIQHNLNSLYHPAFVFETLLTRLSILSFDASALTPFWVRMNYVAGIIFIIAMLYTGYLLLFSSIDASKRAASKKQLWNLFLIIVFSNLSLSIALLILELANLLARHFWTSLLQEEIASQSMISIIFSVQPILSIFYFLIFLIFGIPLLVKMIARIILLISFLVSLPILVTLNFFLPTKRFGRHFLKLFIINAFFPVLWTLVYVFGKIVVSIVAGGAILANDLAQVLVFAGCLYLNNHLYKKLAFNISLKEVAQKTIATGAKLWRAAKVAGALAG